MAAALAELEDDIASEVNEDFDEADGGADDDSEEDEVPRKSATKAAKRGGAQKRPGKAAKRSRNIFIDDAAEEDDDEEDAGAKRQTKQKRSRYIDDMAAEDRDAEEEDEEEHEEGFDDLIADDADADTVREGHSNYQQVSELRRRENDMTEEELEEFVRKKYESRSYAQADEEEDIGLVGQQGLLPSKSDARLWAVQCKPGAEREAVVCLLQKAVEFAARNERLGMGALGIKSAFAHDHIKGFIWVEAHKMDYVRDALRGLRLIFHSKPVHQVPLAQMVETISVPKPSQALLERGSWARMKSGLYKDDLVRVIDVDYSSKRATIEVVPRLDYANLNAPKQAFGRTKSGIRPPPRPFNPGEAREGGATVERESRRLTDGSVFYVVDGKLRFNQGYLQRQCAISSLRICETLPPLDELQRFKQAAQSAGDTDATPGDLSALMDTLKGQEAPPPKFVKGDRVKVVAGELTGMEGRVVRIDEEGMVHVRAKDLEGVTEALEIEARDLVKHFNEGDHVKVVAGQMSGETGMILQLADNIATLFLDSSRKEVKLFTRDLTESADIVAGIDRLGPYEQHDLVALAEGGVVGVVVECGPDSCRVLTNRGTPDRPEIRTARLPDIKRKLMMRNAVSNDQGLNPVAVGDMVDVKRGAMSDKSGTVKFIFQGSLFLHSREVKTHGGFFCVNARDTRVRGAKANNYSNPGQTPSRVADILAGLRSPGPGRTPGVFRSPQLGASTQSQSLTGTSGGGGFSGRSAGARRDESLVGRSLNIMRGPHRGYRGRVASATETHCRIELEAQYKTVTVKRSDLKLEGQNAVPGSRTPSSPWDAPTTPAHPGGRTPMHSGAQTPMHSWGSQTPMHPGSGSMTPGRAPMTPGRETPGHGNAWNPQTPMRPSDAPATPGTWDPDYQTPGGSFNPSPANGDAYNTQHTQYSPSGTPGGVAATPPVAPGYPVAPTPPTAYTPAYSPSGTPGEYSPADPGSGLPNSRAYSPSHPSGASTPGFQPAANGTDTPAAPIGPSAEARLWSDIHVSLSGSRSGVVRDVDADHVATIALGDTTADGRLQLWQPEDTARAPLAELQLAPCLKGDQVRVVVDSANAPAGFTAELAQIQEDEYILKKESEGGGSDIDIKFVDVNKVGRIVSAAG